jgi:O-acetyl-ADP-ribose deacetylase (regulator of RNase III)
MATTEDQVPTVEPRSYVSWTNKSVLHFAQGTDPIAKIRRSAEDLVLRALQEGWSGPPYDPFRLADILKVRVAPRSDIYEARIVKGDGFRPLIEFNPNKPPSRIRFSIAHEITHTLFPDFLDRARYRAVGETRKEDDWQLELLCNIGAAEILMPTGSFPDLKHGEVNIDRLMELRREFGVSAEAVLIRAVRRSTLDMLFFAASKRLQNFRLDYVVPSVRCEPFPARNIQIPSNSCISECTAIGFTSKRQEYWLFGNHRKKLRVQAVGLAPYPGTSIQRVAGLLFLDDVAEERDPITYLTGNALEPRGTGPQLIAHVVNNQTPRWGGRGFAQKLKEKWPDVQRQFIQWTMRDRNNLSLGNVHEAVVSDNLRVVSMVAQHGYGPSDMPRIRYPSLKRCLASLAEIAANSSASVHMPMIGTGFAQGDWKVIEELIRTTLCPLVPNVTIYRLPS